MKPCPFCSAELVAFGPEQFNHPVNECWLSSVSVKAHEFNAWNRRAAPASGTEKDALCDGYAGSTAVWDINGPKVTLRYATMAQADAAHEVLCAMINAAVAAHTKRLEGGAA
jgi:hypothetical protein